MSDYSSKYHRFHVKITRDPNIYTHPLYHACISHTSFKKPTSIHSIRDEIVNRKLTPSLSVNVGSQGRGSGVSILSLDKENALLASATNDGLISIFDVDELQFQDVNRRKTNPIAPILKLNTRKNISNIIWRDLFPDEIIVTFSFSSQAHLYDLSLENLRPKQVLEIAGTNKTGGSMSSIIWKKQTINKGNGQPIIEEHLIIGSENGFLRCWKLPSSSNVNPINNSLWNIKSNPHRPINLLSPVIGLHLNDLSHLSCINCDGHINVWDLTKQQKTSFVAIGFEPISISNANIIDQAISFLPSSIMLNNKKLALSKVIFSNDLFDNSLLFLENIGLILYSMIKGEVKDFFSFQQLFPVDTKNNSNSICLDPRQPLELSYEQLINISSHQTQSPLIPQMTFTNSKSPCQENSFIITNSINSKDFQLYQYPLSTSFKDRYSHYSTAQYGIPIKSKPYFSQKSPLDLGLIQRNIITGSIETCLLTSPEFSYTFPGQVLSFNPLFNEINVSKDLSLYFQVLGTSSGANEIRIEWFCLETNTWLFQDYSVRNVRNGALEINENYNGPMNFSKNMKAILRGKLFIGSWKNSPSNECSLSYSKSNEIAFTSDDLNLSHDSKRVTSMLFHPTSSLLFTGHTDDTITLSYPKGSEILEDELSIEYLVELHTLRELRKQQAQANILKEIFEDKVEENEIFKESFEIDEEIQFLTHRETKEPENLPDEIIENEENEDTIVVSMPETLTIQNQVVEIDFESELEKENCIESKLNKDIYCEKQTTKRKIPENDIFSLDLLKKLKSSSANEIKERSVSAVTKNLSIQSSKSEVSKPKSTKLQQPKESKTKEKILPIQTSKITSFFQKNTSSK